MRENIYRFRSVKHGNPERKLKMLPDQSTATRAWLFSFFVAACAIISFVVTFLFASGHFIFPM